MSLCLVSPVSRLKRKILESAKTERGLLKTEETSDETEVKIEAEIVSREEKAASPVGRFVPTTLEVSE